MNAKRLTPGLLARIAEPTREFMLHAPESTEKAIVAMGAAEIAAGHVFLLQPGEKLRANGIVNARVISSQWCRCLDTAELLEIGSIEELALLN